MEEVIKLLEETFLNPFSDGLGKNQLYNIVSCKTVSIEIKDSLITIDEQGQEMILEYIQRMNKDNVTDSGMMDVIRKSLMKYFSSSNVLVKLQKKGEAREIKMKRDILRKLVRSSFDTNSHINVETLLTYPLWPVSLALSCSDGTIRKKCKSKLYEATMYDLSILEQNKLLSKSVMNTYFLDLPGCVRTMLKDCVTIWDLAWRIFNSINNQFETIYVVCNIYKVKSIKNAERKLHGPSQKYLLKSPDMKFPADMASFFKDGVNKENLFNLTEIVFIQDKIKLVSKMMFFFNTNHCSKITQSEMSKIPDKSMGGKLFSIKFGRCIYQLWKLRNRW